MSVRRRYAAGLLFAACVLWETARAAPSFQPGGGTLVMSNGDVRLVYNQGSNRIAGGTYTVWMSPDLALPPSRWTRFGTGGFDATELFDFTNPTSPGPPRLFFLIKQ